MAVGDISQAKLLQDRFETKLVDVGRRRGRGCQLVAHARAKELVVGVLHDQKRMLGPSLERDYRALEPDMPELFFLDPRQALEQG